MGIKRTATGRIYFDAGDDRLDEARPDEDRSGSGPDHRQTQVLGLLGQLGDRLQRSESDREELLREVQEYRRTVADLEEKAARAEKIVAAIQGRVSRFEKVETEITKRQEKLETEIPDHQNKLQEKIEAEILARQEKFREKMEEDLSRRQESLEKTAQEQNQKIARTTQMQSDLDRRLKGAETIAGTLEGRIAESVDQQVRLNRRLEKISQDKVRLLRKIERMEEIVLETQEALRARAMVLLTDQSLAATNSASRIPLPPPGSGANDTDSFFDRDTAAMPWWHRSTSLRNAALAGVVGAALIGGWMASSALHPPSAISPQTFENEDTETALAEEDLSADQTGAPDISSPQKENTKAQTAEAVTSPAAPDAEMVQPEDAGITPMDEKELVDAYAKDPDSVAAALNAIEPGTPLPAKKAQDTKEKETAPTSASTASAFPEGSKSSPATPAPAAAPTQTLGKAQDSSSTPQTAEAKPVSDARPDPALPAKFRDIEKRALAGQAEAQHDLAAIYTAGHDGAAQDYTKAAFWFRKAADNGVANAAYNLGVLYHQGLGLKKNMKEAIHWYKVAAEQGHPEAQYNLGIAFIEGIGVPYDPAAAAKYFEAAAASGVVEAAYNLGMIHENGLLGQAHPDLALVWYKTAADKGSPEARIALEQLAKTLGVNPADIDRAASHASAPDTTKKPVPQKPDTVTAPAPLRPDERTDLSPPSPVRGAKALPGMDLPVDNILAYPDTGEAATAAAQSPSTSDTDSGALNQIVISQIQQQLRTMGLYGGKPDGVMGEKTGKAIRSYQSAQGLPVDGRPSESLLVHMLAHDPGAIGTPDTAMSMP